MRPAGHLAGWQLHRPGCTQIHHLNEHFSWQPLLNWIELKDSYLTFWRVHNFILHRIHILKPLSTLYLIDIYRSSLECVIFSGHLLDGSASKFKVRANLGSPSDTCNWGQSHIRGTNLGPALKPVNIGHGPSSGYPLNKSNRVLLGLPLVCTPKHPFAFLWSYVIDTRGSWDGC